MSSDYIPRLRRELLRAGAHKQARWRRAHVARRLRPLAGAAAVALVAAAVVLALPDSRSDETPVEQTAGGLQLNYRLEPSGAATAEQTAQVMRERLTAAGVREAGVSVSSSGSLTITAPPAARADVTALTQPGRLAIYDWERSVLGPRGVPEPANATVTGGPAARDAGAISKAEAEARAAGRSGVAVRAPGSAPDRWFALGADAALTDADVESAGSGVDETTREPIVTIELTARGQSAFTALTRTLAHRGSARAADGVTDLEARQHLAIVLDDQIMSLPFIDFREAPDGLDGSAGGQISGDLTPQAANRVAAMLNTGPLPAELRLESG